MIHFAAGLARFLTLSFSFVLATLAAALFVTFVLFLGSDTSWLHDDPLVAGSAIVFSMSTWFYIGFKAAIPFLLLVGVLEFSRIKSLLFNLLAGGFVGGLVHWIIAGHRAGRWLGATTEDAG